VGEDTLSLIERAQLGDRAAMNALYERYSQRVLVIVRSRLGQRLRRKMESCDLVQSVLLASFRDFNKFEYRGEKAFLRWLSRIVENRIRDKRDFFSARKRDVAREEPLEREERRESRFIAGSEPTPSRRLVLSEQLLQLERAMDRLPSEYREIIIRAKHEGMSLEEIAEAMGRSKDAARMLLARALTRLSGCMGEKDND